MKILHSILTSVAMILTLTSCQKENQQDTPREVIRICARTSAPQVVKTSIEQDLSVSWSQTGEVTKLVELYYTQSGTGVQSVDSNADYTISQDGKTANFNFDIEKYEAQSRLLAMIYPASAYSQADPGNKTVTMSVPAEQVPSASSSDPDASLVSWASEELKDYPEGINAALKHVAAYGKMTIKDCQLKEGEKVECVEFRAKGKAIAGELTWGVESGEISAGGTTYDKIIIKTDNIDCSNDFELYFGCIPFSLEAGGTISVKVVTDKRIYALDKQTESELNFIQGHISSFGVVMSGIEPKLKDYKKVTSTREDWSGTYLIAAETSKKIFNGTSSGKWGITSDVTVSSTHSIAWSAAIEDYAVTIEKAETGYTIKVDSGEYMNWTDKYFSLGTTGCEYQIAMDSESNILISYGNLYLKYNAQGNGGLRAYASAMTSIQLFKQEEDGGGGGGGEEESIFQKSWLSGYEIPGTDVTLEEGGVVNYNGHYCHSTVDESHGDTKVCIYNTASSTQRIVTHTFSYNSKINRTYTLLFDQDKRCALWCAFAMNGDSFPDCQIGRHDEWTYDPGIDKSWQPNLYSAYVGYSRGHQAASEDRQTSKEQNKQTFYFSNMTPQCQSLNGGTWGTLEGVIQKIGYACTGRDTLYVVTGPIFQGAYETTTDRDGTECPVPTHYYKCTMRCSFNTSGTMTSAEGHGYLFVHDGTNAPRQTVSIDKIEEMTGFDLFANVPDELETAAEK